MSCFNLKPVRCISVILLNCQEWIDLSDLKLCLLETPVVLILVSFVFPAMETVITIEYKELIRDGEFEMKTQIQDFLDSKVDEWKFSITTHLWSDHDFRLLRRHFSLQLLVENPGEESVWVPLPYDSTISECLNLAQCRARLTSYRIRVHLNPDRTVGNCGDP